MIRIALTDDHNLFRAGIRSLLQTEADIEIVAEFDNALDLLAYLEQDTPDLVIADISMPGMSGIELTRQIGLLSLPVQVLILSMYNDEDFVCNAVKAGASGYLPKDIRKEELIHAIHEIVSGKLYFSQEISNLITKSFIQNATQQNKTTAVSKTLTKRETEIVKLVSEGFINKEIADQLNISIRTVDAHKSNIMQKLQLKSNVEMVKYAIKHGIVSI